MSAVWALLATCNSCDTEVVATTKDDWAGWTTVYMENGHDVSDHHHCPKCKETSC